MESCEDQPQVKLELLTYSHEDESYADDNDEPSEDPLAGIGSSVSCAFVPQESEPEKECPIKLEVESHTSTGVDFSISDDTDPTDLFSCIDANITTNFGFTGLQVISGKSQSTPNPQYGTTVNTVSTVKSSNNANKKVPGNIIELERKYHHVSISNPSSKLSNKCLSIKGFTKPQSVLSSKTRKLPLKRPKHDYSKTVNKPKSTPTVKTIASRSKIEPVTLPIVINTSLSQLRPRDRGPVLNISPEFVDLSSAEADNTGSSDLNTDPDFVEHYGISDSDSDNDSNSKDPFSDIFTGPLSSDTLSLKELIAWLHLQKKTAKSIGLVILLKPDPTLFDFTSSEINEERPIECCLCLRKLESPHEVKSHVENCWFHNKFWHVQCLSCEVQFPSCATLRQHVIEHHPIVYPKPPIKALPNASPILVDHQKIAQIQSELQLLPLDEWIKKQRELSPMNVILLDPDPTIDCDNPIAISARSPVTCGLCRLKLPTEELAKFHLEVCWRYNKKKHCYCFPCKSSFAEPRNLQRHRRTLHIPKHCKLLPFYCSSCDLNFYNKLYLDRHLRSYKDFFDQKHGGILDPEIVINKIKVTATHIQETISVSSSESSPVKSNAIEKSISFESETLNEDAFILSLKEWLTLRKEIPYPVNNWTAFQLDPDPTLVDQLVINENNPITCLLCFAKLDSEKVVRIHVDNCFLHNRNMHRFCIECQCGFSSPRSLKQHKILQHSDPDDENKIQTELNQNFSASELFVESEVDATLPLNQWIQQQKIVDPTNIIVLEPQIGKSDPAISNSSPITCLLCKLKLTSEPQLRNHVKTCWRQNKPKHSYCVPCKESFWNSANLGRHNRRKHKLCPEFRYYCDVCDVGFLEELKFKQHQKSLRAFLHFKDIDPISTSRRTEPATSDSSSQYKKSSASDSVIKNNRSTESALPIENSFISMSYDDWLKTISDQKSDEFVKDIICTGSNSKKIIILKAATVTEDSACGTSSPFDFNRIKPDCPVKCFLCSAQLQIPKEIKIHAENCWFHNKSQHRYCSKCQLGFESPQLLKQHKIDNHFEDIIIEEPEFLMETENSSESESVPLNQWIHNQRKKFPSNIILLKPDPTSQNWPSSVNHLSTIQCKLCSCQLKSEEEVKKHVKICWRFNKSKHNYCIQCKVPYALPTILQRHAKHKHNTGPYFSFYCNICQTGFWDKSDLDQHENSLFEFFGKHKASSMIRKMLEIKGITGNVSSNRKPRKSEKNRKRKPKFHGVAFEPTPFNQWLIQRKLQTVNTKTIDDGSGPKNIIRLDPDIFSSENSEFDSNSISLQSPIICLLCNTKLTNEFEVQVHADNCYLHNTKFCCYCFLCDCGFKNKLELRVHKLYKHANNGEDNTEIEDPTEKVPVNPHEKILQSSGNAEEDIPLAQWIINFKNEDKTNIILLEPEPTANGEGQTVSELSPITCTLCTRKLKSEDEVKKHVKFCWHFNKKLHRHCVLCNVSYSTTRIFKNHNSQLHVPPAQKNKYPFFCESCFQRFQKKNELLKHLHSHRAFKDLRSRKEEEPRKTMRDTHNIVTDIKNDLGLDVDLEPGSSSSTYCTECKKSYKSNESFIIHKRRKHLPRKKLKCKECGKDFLDARALSQHERSHMFTENTSLGFACKHCDKRFITRSRLVVHMRTHTQERPFKCPEEGCNVARSAKHTLQAHMISAHGMLTNFMCSTCGKSFQFKKGLEDHERMHRGEKPYECPVKTCKAQLSSHMSLYFHKRNIHAKELGLKHFLCYVCGKICVTQGLLKHHMESKHEKKKIYQCKYQNCSVAFNFSRQMDEHVREVHTKEALFQCQTCGETFTRIYYVKKHQQSGCPMEIQAN